jgi:UDP-glucuronate 4-epimerase
MKDSNVLITGGAGFIGSHLAERLVSQGARVVIVDNFDPYYPKSIKRANLRNLDGHPAVRIVEEDILNLSALRARVGGSYSAIVHLAAKAGVRPSISDPAGYQEVNVCGTQNMLELARECNVRQFVFASSSSVYGTNPNVPWREDNYVLQPISPYASTKISGELMGHVYSHLYDMRFIALRFFTVYGPRQRPDLAIYKFTKLISEGRPVPIYGDGRTRRDYTYVDDILSGIMAAIDYRSSVYEVINLGNSNTISLSEMIRAIEEALDLQALIDRYPEQAGDVPQTYADVEKAHRLLGYEPKIKFAEGLRRFVEWYQSEAAASAIL